MQKNQQKSEIKESAETVQKATVQAMFKNQNPNQNHNTKKQSLGPNTKR